MAGERVTAIVVEEECAVCAASGTVSGRRDGERTTCPICRGSRAARTTIAVAQLAELLRPYLDAGAPTVPGTSGERAPAMTRIACAVAVLVALAVGAAARADVDWPIRTLSRQGGIDVVHDDVRGVTCWRTVQGGISCLPDRAIRP